MKNNLLKKILSSFLLVVLSCSVLYLAYGNKNNMVKVKAAGVVTCRKLATVTNGSTCTCSNTENHPNGEESAGCILTEDECNSTCAAKGGKMASHSGTCPKSYSCSEGNLHDDHYCYTTFSGNCDSGWTEVSGDTEEPSTPTTVTCNDGQIYDTNSNECKECSNSAHVKTWSSGCTPATCEAGYHVSGNNCVQNTYTYIAAPDNKKCKSDLKYTGSEQQITTETSGTGYTLSEYNQTNAGNYTVKATLKGAYRWNSDPSTGTRTFECSIGAKNLSVTWSSNGTFTYDGNKHSETPSVETGVTGETMTFSRVYKNSSGTTLSEAPTEVGSYSVTVSCNKVTGGQEKCDNYTLTNTTAQYSIVAGSAGDSVPEVTDCPEGGSHKIVKFETNGGNSIDDISICVACSPEIVTLPIPIKSGYTFEGWYADSNLTTKVEGTTNDVRNAVWTEVDACDKETTLYAKWIDIDNSVSSYTITFDGNGGNTCSPNTKTIIAGEKLGTLCTPTRSGFTFNGWFTLSVGGKKLSKDTIVDSDMTIYAQWVKKVSNPKTGIVTPIIALIVITILATIGYFEVKKRNISLE